VVDEDLLPLLCERLRGKFSPVLAYTTATMLLSAGSGQSYTVAIDQGRLTAARGAPRRPTTTISAPIEVLRQVVDGSRSGIEAFLDGDLFVRGNLALSLQMDGLFVGDAVAHGHRPHTRTVTAEGVDTFYIESGPPDGPTVVLAHGLGATNASMLPLIIALSDRYRVLAPDLPGHGASGIGRDSYAAHFLGTWLVEFIRLTSDGEPVVLVGNSLGGRVSLEAAMLAPELLRGCVLLCPAVAFRRLRQFVPVVRILRPELALVPVRFPRAMAMRGLRSLFAQSDRLREAWYEAAIDEFTRVLGTREGRVAFFASLRQIYLDEPFGEEGFWERLPAMKPPALFVWGDKDVLVPAGFARHVDQALPGARTVILSDCGHVPQFEFRERTAQLVDEFILGLDQPDMLTSPQVRSAHS
jgi:pimeloyl-ACP methyl ester carboxylesterase